MAEHLGVADAEGWRGAVPEGTVRAFRAYVLEHPNEPLSSVARTLNLNIRRETLRQIALNKTYQDPHYRPPRFGWTRKSRGFYAPNPARILAGKSKANLAGTDYRLEHRTPSCELPFCGSGYELDEDSRACCNRVVRRAG